MSVGAKNSSIRETDAYQSGMNVLALGLLMCKTVSQIKKFTLSLFLCLSRDRGDVVLWFWLLFVCVFSDAGMKESADMTHGGKKVHQGCCKPTLKYTHLSPLLSAYSCLTVVASIQLPPPSPPSLT